MRIHELQNKFVSRIPDQISEGVLYICLECDLVVHKCPCGCGEIVYLPLAPEHWQLYYDGEVSLKPSIGNYNYDCHSHYFIRNGRIDWVNNGVDSDKKKKRKKNKKKKSPIKHRIK